MSQPIAKKSDQYRWQADCGPLESFLSSDSVNEIMVNGPFKIFVEQNGILKRTNARFASEKELLKLMKKLCELSGKTLDESNPIVDTVLSDGSRINCILPPISVDGPVLTIRRFRSAPLGYKDLVASGSLDEKIAYFLSCAVQAKLNIVVAGGTGAGKTTLLNVISSFIPAHERIITIEDAPELRLAMDNLVRMETRPPNAQDGGVSVRHLIINALRMRPDRIIVGECRGPEAWDMLAAMNTGHEGSMTTVHANSARDALRRLETMALMAGTEMPLKVVRQHLSSSIDMIIQVTRDPQGIRRVSEVIEIGRMEGDTILSQDIFRYTPSKGFHSLGLVPQFIHEFKDKGISFPVDFFTDSYRIKTK